MTTEVCFSSGFSLSKNSETSYSLVFTREYDFPNLHFDKPQRQKVYSDLRNLYINRKPGKISMTLQQLFRILKPESGEQMLFVLETDAKIYTVVTINVNSDT